MRSASKDAGRGAAVGGLGFAAASPLSVHMKDAEMRSSNGAVESAHLDIEEIDRLWVETKEDISLRSSAHAACDKVCIAGIEPEPQHQKSRGLTKTSKGQAIHMRC